MDRLDRIVGEDSMGWKGIRELTVTLGAGCWRLSAPVAATPRTMCGSSLFGHGYLGPISGTGLALRPSASVQVPGERSDTYDSGRRSLPQPRRTQRIHPSHATAATHFQRESGLRLPPAPLPWLVDKPTPAMKDVGPPFLRAHALLERCLPEGGERRHQSRGLAPVGEDHATFP